MEKRLPLFLFLSAMVLITWPMLFGEPPKPSGTTEAATSAGVPATAADEIPVPADESEPVGELVGEAAERETEELLFGRRSEVGTYLARFSNRGARLVELRLGDFAGSEGLDEEEILADPANWVQLLAPIEQPDGSFTGSMLWRTSPSSKDLVRGTSLAEALWTMEVLRDASGEPTGVEFQLAPGTGVRFVKRFRFEPGTRAFYVDLELHNEGESRASSREFILTPASCMPPELDDQFYVEPQALAAGPLHAPVEDMTLAVELRQNSASDLTGPLQVPSPLAFAGVHNKYFALILSEVLPDPTAKPTMIGAAYARVPDAAFARENPKEARSSLRFIDADVYLDLRLPEPGESGTWTYRMYAGPKERESFLAADPAHQLVLDEDLGWMSGIGNFLVGVLGTLHRAVGNWGWAIIILTVIIRVILFPLNRRFQTSMARYQKKMKRVQPKIEEVKERYKGDPQKQRQEQARIMQEEGAFPPLGGCLPMFLQIPIFIGLFGALRTHFDLRHAPFVSWITDLSQPDRLVELGLEIPVLVTTLEIEYLNLLPILMVVLWVLQQRGMPTPADEQAARMQKMMMFMPIVMGFFLYSYAAGLSLYMITQSGLGIFEQKIIKKRWPIDDTEVETKKKKSGCGPFSGFMENIAEKQKEHLKRMEAMQKQKKQGGGQRGGQRKKKRR